MAEDVVYLICLGGKYKHASHYVGWSNRLMIRLKHHLAGTGAGLLRAASRAGLNWKVVRTWDAGKDFEKKLHRYKNSRDLCPVCNPDGWAKHYPAVPTTVFSTND